MVKHDLSIHHFQRKISDFCEVRIAQIASKRVVDCIRSYLIGLVIHRRPPPIVNGRMDWTAIGQTCGIEGEMKAELKKQLRPGLDAIIRWLGAPPVAEDILSTKPRAKSKKAVPRKSETVTRSRPQQILSDKIPAQSSSMPREPQPKPISPFPEPLFEATDDPTGFHDALVYQMRRFGESYWQLYRAVIRLGETFDDKTHHDRLERIAMHPHDTLDFLRAIGSVPVECIAGAVPVTRRKVYLLWRDQPFDWLNLLQELRMLADPAHLRPGESLGDHQHVFFPLGIEATPLLAPLQVPIPYAWED